MRNHPQHHSSSADPLAQSHVVGTSLNVVDLWHRPTANVASCFSLSSHCAAHFQVVLWTLVPEFSKEEDLSLSDITDQMSKVGWITKLSSKSPETNYGNLQTVQILKKKKVLYISKQLPYSAILDHAKCHKLSTWTKTLALYHHIPFPCFQKERIHTDLSVQTTKYMFFFLKLIKSNTQITDDRGHPTGTKTNHVHL